MKKNNILFHIEARGGYIATYGSSTASISHPHVHQERCSGFLDNKDRDCFRCDEDYDRASIKLTDNLFNGIAATKQYSISMWIFVSDMTEYVSFYPFKCTGVKNEIYIEKNVLVYRTQHYYAGVTYKTIIPNNRWCHILITVDCTRHGDTKVRLYVDGRIMSLGYTESSFDPGSGLGNTGYTQDFMNIATSVVTNEWELPGNSQAGLYLLREFTIYNTCLVNDENFIPPHHATNVVAFFVPAQVKFMGYFNIGSKDPHCAWLNVNTVGATANDTHGVDKMGDLEKTHEVGLIYETEVTTQYRSVWTQTFTSPYQGVVSIWFIWKYIKHITQDQSEDLEDPDGTAYTNKWDGQLRHYESQDGLKKFSGQLTLKLNGRVIKKSNIYQSVDYYSEFFNKIAIYVYAGTNTLEVSSTNNMPFNYLKFWIVHREYDIVGGVLRKSKQWDIYTRLVVPEYAMHHDINSWIEVDNSGGSEVEEPTGIRKHWEVTLEIPYPYPQFTEMEWILVAPDGRFVPEVFYDKIDDYHIKFKNGNVFNAGHDEDFKFTFLHKHGFYAVNKFEQNVYATPGTIEYQFESPYNGIVDLQKRVKVFVNCEFLNPNISLYQFDNTKCILRFSNNFPLIPGDLITMLCFYTGTKDNDDTIARLPMSGYIEFRPMNIDRIYDKDLFAVFMNGKLVSRDDITDMTSNIHKINRDIKTRYNLEVMNMSPCISYMTPYLLAAHKRLADKTVVEEIPCQLTVPFDGLYRPRHYVSPDIFNPVEWRGIVPENNDFYISLIHHGLNKAEKDYQKELTYTLKFFRDEWARNPEQVFVYGQARLKGNEEQFYPDHDSNTLIGILPSTLTNTSNDSCLMSIRSDVILRNDYIVNKTKYGESIDGIMCRMEIQRQQIDNWSRLYYELVCNNYERDTEIEILEWRISSKPNGEGEIWYQKTIPFLPYETPDFPDLD